ncbi:hypothetical protein ACRALDRAFT_206631 [Sodiomyces alcalophilus JCM 7366]|uniref:uncharacterized protein n=1 Tax=Sodiomyces alcalophilus JCM 7366 TaxID=591952 RepID=UPI0039B498AE
MVLRETPTARRGMPGKYRKKRFLLLSNMIRRWSVHTRIRANSTSEAPKEGNANYADPAFIGPEMDVHSVMNYRVAMNNKTMNSSVKAEKNIMNIIQVAQRTCTNIRISAPETELNLFGCKESSPFPLPLILVFNQLQGTKEGNTHLAQQAVSPHLVPISSTRPVMAEASSFAGNPGQGYIESSDPPTAATICCVALNCNEFIPSFSQLTSSIDKSLAGSTPRYSSYSSYPCSYLLLTDAFQPSEHKRNLHNGPDNVSPNTHYVCPVPGCRQGQLILRSDYPGSGRFDEFQRHFREDHSSFYQSLDRWALHYIYLGVRAVSDMAPDTIALERKQLELKHRLRDIGILESRISQLEEQLQQANSNLYYPLGNGGNPQGGSEPTKPRAETAQRILCTG